MKPNHLSISSLNFAKEVSVFNCLGREFQTRGAKDLKLLSPPKVTLFRVGIFKSYFFETEFSLFFFKIVLNESSTVFFESFKNF